jgi:hypothetical protein
MKPFETAIKYLNNSLLFSLYLFIPLQINSIKKNQKSIFKFIDKIKKF